MPIESLERARILIVEDEPQNVDVLTRLLAKKGYREVVSTTDPRDAHRIFLETRPDLILLDLHMPHLDGFDIMGLLRPEIPDDTYLPILVLTGDQDPEIRARALEAGARDFVTKPFEVTEVLLRIKNLLETRFLHRQLAEQNRDLEEKVAERTRDLYQAQNEIIHRLALAAEYRDDVTGKHTERVGILSRLIAEELELDRAEVELIRRTAPLHDVGKIGIPDAILMKPDHLTRDEFEVMKTHATIGARILSGSPFPVLRRAQEIALAHHERWDGGGYPEGLEAEEIPLWGRIVAVADVYDSLIHARPYKPRRPREEAFAVIHQGRGTQFDPQVVDAFFRIVHSGRTPRSDLETFTSRSARSWARLRKDAVGRAGWGSLVWSECESVGQNRPASSPGPERSYVFGHGDGEGSGGRDLGSEE